MENQYSDHRTGFSRICRKVFPGWLAAFFVLLPDSLISKLEEMAFNDRKVFTSLQDQTYLKSSSGSTLSLVDIGQLDTTPESQIFSGDVGTNGAEDYYHFTLQASSEVIFELSGLNDGANLYLGDSEGNLIAQSNNRGTQDEVISVDLEPGIYQILVRSTQGSSTSYELSLSAQFITRETSISFGRVDIVDPEFDSINSQVTWQDKQDNLWVAPVQADGDFDLDQAQSIASGLAPIPKEKNGTGNGPEWTYTSEGSSILFTKLRNNNFRLGLAQQINGVWQTTTLPESKFMHAPKGTLNPGDPNPLVAYFIGSPENRRSELGWGPVSAPSTGGLIPFAEDGDVGQIRWVEGETALVYSIPINRINQVVRYDVETDELTQLTFDRTQKGGVFAWKAPEYNNETLLMIKQTNGLTSRDITKVGIYRNLNGQWLPIKIIEPPSDLKSIRSPEPFTYNGKSYISMLTENEKGKPSEVWIAGIDPEVDFYRQVSDPNATLVRNDPETFETPSGLFVYYAIRGEGVIIHADSGLGEPIPQ